jgi:hypothetical protein
MIKGTKAPSNNNAIAGLLEDHSFIKNQGESPSGGSISVMLREYEDHENANEAGDISLSGGKS